MPFQNSLNNYSVGNGAVGTHLNSGFIDVLKDLGMDFPLEKPASNLAPGSVSYNQSTLWDLCGNYALIEYAAPNGAGVQLYNLVNGGKNGFNTLVRSHAPGTTNNKLTRFAIGSTCYAIVDTGVSPYTVTSYNISTGATMGTKTYTIQPQDIATDGTYFHLVKTDGTIDKLDSALNVIANSVAPTGWYPYSVNDGYTPTIFVPKGNNNPYFYWWYPYNNASKLGIVKFQKSNLSVVASNITDINHSGNYSHITGVDYQNDIVYVANQDSNPYLYINILNSTLSTAYKGGWYDVNDNDGLYMSAPHFGNGVVKFHVKNRNNSTSNVGQAQKITLDRASFSVKNNLLISTAYTNPQVQWTPIVYDVNQIKYLKIPELSSYSNNAGLDLELNIGFYTV